jgi:hypothetical protein
MTAVNFKLYRYDSDEVGTFGILHVNGKYVCDTLELPWKNNQKGISCIPEGTYKLSPFHSITNGECVYVEDVPDRAGIEMHAANFARQLKGCIAVGIKYGNSLQMSKVSLAKVLAEIKVNETTLEVTTLK